MATVLSLDPGTQCGWALMVGKGALASGRWNLKEDRFSGGGMRFVRLRKYLEEVHSSSPIDQVVLEEVRRHRGVDAAHAYGGYLATITSFCEENSIPYEAVPVGTWKKWLVGKGNASKEDVVDAVQRLGLKPASEDEADALAILLYWTQGDR